jgi:pyruvate,water dikinase
VEELLAPSDISMDEALQGVVNAVVPGMQYPETCAAAISYGAHVYSSTAAVPTPWVLHSDILVQGEIVGWLSIFYTQKPPDAEVGPFLKEEVHLANTIAERLGHYLLFQRLRGMRDELGAASGTRDMDHRVMWRAAIHLLRQSDEVLYLRIARKMLNDLCSVGVPEAQAMLHDVGLWSLEPEEVSSEVNVPGQRVRPRYAPLMSDRLLDVAS